ncbi:MAG: hypothetical protein M1828_002789 [Chrysothrix sp. TS-e1954]|nr:MAG: hypothetical protein M1828_002789 [Chrysothrix sp. TS-e1954]
MHPRLFRGLVLIEPVIAVPDKINVPVRSNRNLWMAKREEIWPSRKAARDSLLQNKGYYALFDHRVFEKTMEHDLVSVAPEVARSAGVVLQSGEQPVRLKTPKSMQVYTLAGRAMSVSSLQKCMPLILPEVLLVWGELSDISAMQHYRDYIWNTVGTAPEGGGGAAKGQLEIVWIRKSRHAVALEQPTSLAEGVTPWLLRQAKDWEEEMKQRGNGGIAWTEESNSDLIHRLEKL